MFRSLYPLILAIISIILFVSPTETQAANFIVNDTTPNGWVHGIEPPSSTGDGGFEVGPGGVDSFRFTTPDTGSRYILAYPGGYNGLRLDAISNISYRAHQSLAGSSSVTFQIHVDYDVTDGDTSWQGRLVFQPINTPGNNPLADVWQTWDALNGNWWASGAPGNGVCSQGTPCSWATVLANFPNAGIRAGDGTILFKVGNGFPAGSTGFVDSLAFNGDNFDFGSATVSSSTAPTIPACYFGDDRLNELYGGDCAAPIVTYCHAWGITVYQINPETSQGYLIMDMTFEEIDAIGIPEDRNIILAQTNNVIFSRLTTGEFQVNANYFDGKPYAILWDDCPASYALRIEG